MLTHVVDLLVCPVCGAGLAVQGSTLHCLTGHTFDIARQGYVNLLPGHARPGTADTAEMAQARERFLATGHFAWLADRLKTLVNTRAPVLDAGAGTGYYLGQALSADSTGLALDLSKHALRRAARAHPRIGAVVTDLWAPLPVRTGSIATILNVFAPRNGPEFHRVLRPDGTLHVVTPTPRHLGRLVPDLGLLTVDEHKDDRTQQTLAPHFEPAARETRESTPHLTRAEVATLVRMSPSAHHISPEDLSKRLEALPDPVEVRLSVALTTYHPR